MAKRACQPGEDLKQIWRLLLPDTPYPSCETPENAGGQSHEGKTPERADDKPKADSRPR